MLVLDILAKEALTDKNDLKIYNDIPPFLLLAFYDDLEGRSFPRRLGVGWSFNLSFMF